MGDWSLHGDDATQEYLFDTSKDNETAEVLDKDVMVFSRRKTPDIDLSEERASQPIPIPDLNIIPQKP